MEKRGISTFAAAAGDGEVDAVLGESFGESDPASTEPLVLNWSGEGESMDGPEYPD